MQQAILVPNGQLALPLESIEYISIDCPLGLQQEVKNTIWLGKNILLVKKSLKNAPLIY